MKVLVLVSSAILIVSLVVGIIVVFFSKIISFSSELEIICSTFVSFALATFMGVSTFAITSESFSWILIVCEKSFSIITIFWSKLFSFSTTNFLLKSLKFCVFKSLVSIFWEFSFGNLKDTLVILSLEAPTGTDFKDSNKICSRWCF